MNVDFELLNEQSKGFLWEIKELKNKSFVYKMNFALAAYTGKIACKTYKDIERKISKERVIEIVLEFYKDLDLDMYEDVKALLMGKKDTKIHIYNEETKKYLPDDDPYFEKYGDGPQVCSMLVNIANIKGKKFQGGRLRAYVPLKGNIMDIFSLAHEIAHTFDTVPGKRKSEKEYLGELTPAVIEMLLGDYLVKQKIVTKNEVNNMITKKDDEINQDAFANVLKFEMAKLKRQEGQLNKENCLAFFSKNKIDLNFALDIYKHMMKKKEEIHYSSRYVVAELIAPYIYQKYKTDKEGTNVLMKNFFGNMKNGTFEECLETLELDESKIDELIQCRTKYVQQIRKEMSEKENLR